MRRYIRRAGLIAAIVLAATAVGVAHSRGVPGRPFTVAEEVGLAQFDEPDSGGSPVMDSADGKYMAVVAEAGVLEENRIEATLRIYGSAAIRSFLARHTRGSSLPAYWTITESTYSEGPLITGIRWLRDSSGIAFLLTNASGRHQLMIALLRSRTVSSLSLPGQDVTGFDVRDRSHYAYTVRSAAIRRRALRDRAATSVVVTGRPLYDLLFPVDVYPRMAAWEDRSDLWAAAGGPPHPVSSPRTRRAVVLFQLGSMAMSLSPDGRTLAAIMPVARVPDSWKDRYRPPHGNEMFEMRPGPQDLDSLTGNFLAGEYVTVDLRSGRTLSLAAAPTGYSAGWWPEGAVQPTWAQDGAALLLPDTFVSGPASRARAGPCLAIVEIASRHAQCLVRVQVGRHPFVANASFVGRDAQRVLLSYDDADSDAHARQDAATEFVRHESGAWRRLHTPTDRPAEAPMPEVTVRQGLNDPPVMVARDPRTHVADAIWDPNPQLQNIALGKATVYRWADRSGRQWIGGLYEPRDYRKGYRYPLVIQNHGFADNEFHPSGVFPTAFAARALAAAGIVVLQVRDCPEADRSDEVECQLRGYEAAVRSLTDRGIIDPRRVGIIGFSRTVSYAMAALIDQRLHLAAASVTDGVNDGYLQYVMFVDFMQDGIERDAESVVGASPFGVNREKWMARSPESNLRRIDAPLLVVGEGVPSMLFMWEPYAGLRLLHKPVDMILLNTDEHVLTNPREQLASQEGTVDWFRFWLQGYEDPDPVKARQYRRWERLCDLQKAQARHEASFCVAAAS